MSPRLLPIVAPILVVGVLSIPGTSLADFQSDFRDGFRAWEDKDWAEAVRLLKRAISQQPEASGKAIEITGTFTEPYTPYLYLGLASYELNQCGEVLTALDRSTGYGSAERRKRRIFTRLQDAGVDCQRREIASLATTIAEQVEAARASARSWEALNNEPGMAERLSPSLQSRGNDARQALEGLEARFATAQQENDLDQLRSVGTGADTLANDFVQLARQLRASPAPDRTASTTTDRPSDPPVSRRSGDRSRRNDPPIENDPSKLRPLPTPGPDRSNRDQDGQIANEPDRTASSDAGTSLDVAAAVPEPTPSESSDPAVDVTEPPTTPDEVVEPRRTDRDAATELERGSTPSPEVPVLASLQQSSAAYLNSDYERALATLQQLQPDEPHSRFVTDLLTAAASFQLFRAGGEKEAALLELSKEAIAQVKRAEPDYLPDPAWFSPAFVALFASGS